MNLKFEQEAFDDWDFIDSFSDGDAAEVKSPDENLATECKIPGHWRHRVLLTDYSVSGLGALGNRNVEWKSHRATVCYQLKALVLDCSASEAMGNRNVIILRESGAAECKSQAFGLQC